MQLINGIYYKITGPEPLELVDPIGNEIVVKYFKVYISSEDGLTDNVVKSYTIDSEENMVTIRGIDKYGIEFYFLLYFEEFQNALEHCKFVQLDFADEKEILKINLIGAYNFFKTEGLLL